MSMMSEFSRREFLLLAGMAASGLVLSACARRVPGVGEDPEEKVQLVYQDWRTEWFPPMAREMLAQFYEAHPNIRVFYTPDPEGFEERMLADMEAGTAADVFQGCCTHLPMWAQMGHTLDLRPYVEADLDQATIDEWDPAQYRSFFTRDGRQYALPKYHGALALYYNKDLFDEYGVEYPDGGWGYDEYLGAMKHLTHDRDGDGETDLWGSMIDVSWERVQVHVNGWGGHFVDPEDEWRSLMGAPESLQAMEWLRARMWDDRVMASRLDVQNMSTRQAFITERIAMVEDGSWALKDILENASFRVGVAPFPAGPVRRATLTTTDGFAIYSGTEHPDAAWELVKFLIGRDYGRAMARASFLQPARASLLDDWAGFIRAEYPEKTEGLDLEAFADGHVKGYSVTIETFPNMAEAKRLAYAAWNELFTLGRASTDVMKDVSRQIEEAQRTVG